MYPLHFSSIHTYFIQTNCVFTVIFGLSLEKYLHICRQLAMLLSPFNISNTLHDLFHCGLCYYVRIRNIFLGKLKCLCVPCTLGIPISKFDYFTVQIRSRPECSLFSVGWISHWEPRPLRYITKRFCFERRDSEPWFK